jgi:hypothetical protein
MMTNLSDKILRDLIVKASEDVAEKAGLTVNLVETTEDRFLILANASARLMAEAAYLLIEDKNTPRERSFGYSSFYVTKSALNLKEK